MVFLQRLRKTNCCSVSCAQWFFCVVPEVKSCQNSFSFVTLFSTSTVTRKYCLSEIEETLRMSKLVLKGLIYATQEDEAICWLLNNFDTDTCTWCWYQSCKWQSRIQDPYMQGRVLSKMLSFAGCCILLMLLLAVDIFVVVFIVFLFVFNIQCNGKNSL